MVLLDTPSATDSTSLIVESLIASFRAAKLTSTPYNYWTARDVLPKDIVQKICDLPFVAPDLGDESGTREKHNLTRTYFDAQNRKSHSFVDATAMAFQNPKVTTEIEQLFGTSLSGSYLRMEYAQDTDGFWLEPHSDLGVKSFTLLLYLSDDPAHSNLGTDVYDSNKTHVTSVPFAPNQAMIFIPSDITFHGFEPQVIPGVRKSLIVNYVTDEWRAREQLAFQAAPIGR